VNRTIAELSQLHFLSRVLLYPHTSSTIHPNKLGAPKFLKMEKSAKKLLRKIDWALIPFLSLLYLLSFLDRTNIGNARLAGLEMDLGMAGFDYNVALSVFFPWYVAAEIPSNLAMRRLRPSIWIPSIMVAWGVVCTLMGLVQNYAGLLAARMALGIAEGGLFPGITF
jgi:hypothetical protein